MHGRAALPLVLAALSLQAGLLPAQARKPVVGNVKDLDGRPVADAEIVLFWTPPGDALGAHTDVVKAGSDERGRFVAQLLPQRGYSIVAASAAGTAPRRTSEPRDDIAAGADIEVCLVATAAKMAVELRGASAWQAEQPLRLIAAPRARNVLAVPIDLHDSCGWLPPFPVTTFAVLTAGGEVLWSGTASKAAIDLPPPVEIRLRVVDAQGAGVAGASVRQALGGLAARSRFTPLFGASANLLRNLGTTNADGTLAVRVPSSRDPWEHDEQGNLLGKDRLDFFASFAGRGTSMSGLDTVYFRDGKQAEIPADHTVVLTLQPRSRLLLPPLLAVTANLNTRWSLGTAGGAQHGSWIVPCMPDAEGVLDLPFADGATSGLLDLEGLRRGDRELPRTLLSVAPTGEEHCHLANLRCLLVQLVDHDGGPARGVPVTLIPHTSDLLGETPPSYSDQAGRVAFCTSDGDWLLFACDGKRAAWRSWNDADHDEDWRLELQDLPSMACRCVDADGNPVVGATVAQLSWKSTGGTPRTGEDRLLCGLEERFGQCRLYAHHSDADGRMVIPMLLPAPHHTWTMRLAMGQARFQDVTWQASVEPVRVLLR